ncbi:MAG: hypothetical protein FI697_02935 [SAR202 cluster bacterium]|nr:hypothetical protein [SAR202 cluster bacterium]
MTVLNITRWNAALGVGREFANDMIEYTKMRKADGAKMALVASSSEIPGVFWTLNRYEDQGEADRDLASIFDSDAGKKRDEIQTKLAEKLRYTRGEIIVPMNAPDETPQAFNSIQLVAAKGRSRDFRPRIMSVVDYISGKGQKVGLIAARSGNINRCWLLLSSKDQGEADRNTKTNYDDPAFLTAWFDMVESLEQTPELQRGTLLLSTND